jgi:DNA-binding CsgD family transcriptional regulator
MTDVNNYFNLNQYNEQKSAQLRQIIDEDLKNSPIKEFAFQRFYPQGRHLSLFSHVDYRKYYFNSRIDLGITFYNIIINLKRGESLFYIWPNNSHDEIFNILLSFNIYYGMTIFIKEEQYVDAYHFSGDRDSYLLNFYINNIIILKNFIKCFKEKAQKLIITNEEKILGIHTGIYKIDNFNHTDVTFSHRSKVEAIIDGKTVLIGSQEFKCLELLAQGHSHKIIAIKLNLSPRTVESYIASLKRKLGLFSKDSLVDFFHQWYGPKLL